MTSAPSIVARLLEVDEEDFDPQAFAKGVVVDPLEHMLTRRGFHVGGGAGDVYTVDRFRYNRLYRFDRIFYPQFTEPVPYSYARSGMTKEGDAWEVAMQVLWNPTADPPRCYIKVGAGGAWMKPRAIFGYAFDEEDFTNALAKIIDNFEKVEKRRLSTDRHSLFRILSLAFKVPNVYVRNP